MACQHPAIPRSPGKNWIERIPGGRIPEEIECVARALYHGAGRAAGDKQVAYRMAVGVAEDWAAGRKNISPEKQAKYVKAVAAWQALRARAKADNLSSDGGRVVLDLASARDLLDLARDPKVDRVVAALRKKDRFKGKSTKALRAAANRRLGRQALGIQNVNRATAAQQKALQRTGLLPGQAVKPGMVVQHTLTRGPRKGKTITIKVGRGGSWSEVKPRAGQKAATV